MYKIAIEGVDASGKETQCHLLEKYCTDMGLKTIIVSFPRYTTPVGELIYKGLRNQINISDKALHMLMEVDKQDFIDIHYYAIMCSAYDVVIFDRYKLSNLIYASLKGIDISWLKELQTYLPEPDIGFILYAPAEVTFSRKHENFTDLDKHEMDFHYLRKVANLYDNYHLLQPQGGYYKINAAQSVDDVFKDITSCLKFDEL